MMRTALMFSLSAPSFMSCLTVTFLLTCSRLAWLEKSCWPLSLDELEAISEGYCYVLTSLNSGLWNLSCSAGV